MTQPMTNLKTEYLQKHPCLAEKFSFPGTLGLYLEQISATIPANSTESIFDNFIAHEVRRILPNHINPEKLKRQIRTYRVVSCADHHGLLNYSLLYQSNIILSELVKKNYLPYVIVLSTGTIPLSNISHPRGFYYKKEKLNFFNRDSAHIPVCLMDQRITPGNEIGSFIRGISKYKLTPDEKKYIEHFFYTALQIHNVSNYGSYSDQVTILNFDLWKYFFTSSIRDSRPGLVYLQFNAIIVEYILHELKNPESLISKIVLNPQIRQIYLKTFTGIPCCWSSISGTHFFWGVNDRKRLVRLAFDASRNCLSGEGIMVEMVLDVIVHQLENKKIIPSSFFDLLIIVFLENYLALGGFNQIEYLPQMQAAHVRCLKEIGEQKLAEEFASRITDGFICGMLPFPFDSGIDLIWHCNSHDGRFNGNLDNGLTQADLDRMLEMPVSDLVSAGIRTMMDITGFD